MRLGEYHRGGGVWFVQHMNSWEAVLQGVKVEYLVLVLNIQSLKFIVEALILIVKASNFHPQPLKKIKK